MRKECNSIDGAELAYACLRVAIAINNHCHWGSVGRLLSMVTGSRYVAFKVGSTTVRSELHMDAKEGVRTTKSPLDTLLYYILHILITVLTVRTTRDLLKTTSTALLVGAQYNTHSFNFLLWLHIAKV